MPIPTGKALSINCPVECSLHPDKIGEGKADILKGFREAGHGSLVFSRMASEVLGYPVPKTNVVRHFKHYHLVDADDPEPLASPKGGGKASDLEILDSIIVAGFRNSKNWKPSIKDTLDAMKLKVQMTGNSAFDDLLALFDSADDDGETPEEAPEAVFSPDELPDASEDELDELPGVLL